ncbi:hypothetical protein B0H19DRAFT_1272078 [Mycena capillaripes]|nr:hypothetical protein B0H19DRAFT_1272078 [Mycena capillaripes]
MTSAGTPRKTAPLRKIKCGGERPKCTQCARSQTFQDCEYPQNGPTTGQRLEEQIANIAARIEELENPTEIRSAIVLRNPYTASSSSHGDSVHLPHSPLSQQYTSYPASVPMGIPQVDLDSLVHKFLHHSSQFGFFLNIQRFGEAAMNRSGQRPTALLRNVVHLWAIHLSGSDRFIIYEPEYLSRALRTAVDALSGTHHHNTILHTIQAEVLLSHYFLQNTRFLEGKYHVTKAVSLAISSHLHRIRSGDSNSYAGGGGLGSASPRLPPPRDATEEAERVAAFWAVLTLDNCWTAADGSPSNILYTGADTRIDTPWPLDINAPGLHAQMMPDSSLGTVTNFLANRFDSAVSVAALHAKAAILFTQAAQLASQYRPIMSNEQSSQFYRSFNSIDTLIEGFKTTLPAIHSHPTRQMLIIHSLVHVATIQLHTPFVVNVEPSGLRVLDSARAVVTALAELPMNEFLFIDPIMGTLFMATSQAFITELQHFRRHRPWNGRIPHEESALTSSIETVLAAMNIFAARCPLMESQLRTMRQLYHGL